MKFCRFVPKSAGVASPVLPAYGLLDGETIHKISAAPWVEWSRENVSLALREARLLAPVEPSKVVCVGRNYAAHAAEMGNELPKEPLIFLKAPSSITGPEEPIVLTSYSKQVEHEGELAVVIGKPGRHIPAANRVDETAARRAGGNACERKSPPVGQHFPDGFSGDLSGALDFPHDDAVPGRCDRHGHSLGRWPDRAGGFRGGLHLRDWHIAQSGARSGILTSHYFPAFGKIRNRRENFRKGRFCRLPVPPSLPFSLEQGVVR